VLERGLCRAPGLQRASGADPSKTPAGTRDRAKLQSVSAHPGTHKNKKARKTAKSRKRGQQKIDSSRAREIQEA
jgi:hypothetical protein